ncbi:mycothiol transferase [Streptomonospora litoralis]|uniref:DinB superfamily protein n=1 Tax=Streptomonospora litoralis TaxID=2498135 RepID=A0A4V0ZKA0_9ACTN|nr:DinB family protein [Streptomonospora litoralis]QBI56252.1 DinB superfamily protein [Streptomonospora litoralis]
MDATAVLEDGFDRVRGVVHDVLDGVSADELHGRVDEGSNPIAWLIWHMTRVQDDHIADAAGMEQVWLAQGWRDAFGLSLPAADTGFGHTPDEVAAVRVDSAGKLAGYYDATHAQTLEYLRGLDPAALDEVLDASWEPPVTLGARLVSVVAEDLQHVGQAACVRGLLRRR